MPIYATVWVANCDWCHCERNSDGDVVSEPAFVRMIEGEGWRVDVMRDQDDYTCTCPSCVKQGRP